MTFDVLGQHRRHDHGVGDALAPHGLEVVWCEDPAAAKPDADKFVGVLCDVNLGEGLSGIDVAASMRRDGFSGRIIMISGDNRRETVVAAGRAKVNGYLLKPFSKAQLIQTLAPHLGGDGKAPQVPLVRIDPAATRTGRGTCGGPALDA